jgi:CheY-like chemotaxis protein
LLARPVVGRGHTPERRQFLQGTAALVVDDNRDLREMLAALLGARGASVTSARGGDEALTLLRHQTPDVLITDLIMPGMSGFELIARVRKSPDQYERRTAVVVCTGYLDLQEAARRAGCDAYLTKPFDPDQVITTVASVTRQAG